MLTSDIADQVPEGLGLDGEQISPSVFPLPSLGKTLRAMTADLHTKQPFFTLRGLNPNGLTPEDIVLRYLGIVSFVGDNICVQDAHRNVFGKMLMLHHSLTFIDVADPNCS